MTDPTPPAPTPLVAGAVVPTPSQHENDAFATQLAAGTLPKLPWYHAMDGSPIDPHSPDPTAKTSTWP